jgi:Transposase zinc-binding domain
MGRAQRTYQPRQAETTVLYVVIRGHLADFLRAAADRADSATVPEFVAREFGEFLTCGVLAHGFARVRGERCALDRLVPFSCKARGSVRSCGGRRMTERAAHWVDEVLPPLPARRRASAARACCSRSGRTFSRSTRSGRCRPSATSCTTNTSRAESGGGRRTLGRGGGLPSPKTLTGAPQAPFPAAWLGPLDRRRIIRQGARGHEHADPGGVLNMFHGAPLGVDSCVTFGFDELGMALKALHPLV